MFKYIEKKKIKGKISACATDTFWLMRLNKVIFTWNF